MKIKKISESFIKKDIKLFTNTQLISHFKDAVVDDNYNHMELPGEDYNTSGFSVDELEKEILRRMRRG